MSKFPNQLALAGAVGVSVIALSVGLSERAAHKAEDAAHAVETHAAASQEPVAEQAAPVDESHVEATAEAAATEPPADTAVADVAAAAEAPEESAVAEETAAVPAKDKAVEEGAEANASGTPVAAAAVAMVDGATDTLDGQGDTATIAGEDTAPSHGKFGLGRVALPEEIAAWNLDVSPDGTGLPEGSGNAYDGEEIFADYCAVCHGDFAEGVDNWPKLAGGMDTLDHDDPLKTVGSYWPYLSTTFDYVRRSMPFGNAQTLTNDEVYAIVAYILYSNDLIDDEFELSRDSFLDVEMPNTDGFFVDDRADTEYPVFSVEPCMENCKETVEITMRAAVLDVTPEETKAKKIQQLIKDTDPKAAVAESVTAPADAAEAAPADEMTPAAAADAAPDSAGVDPELIAAGEKVFKKCKACHQVGEGAKNRVGPVLNGVFGRSAGTAEGFKFSKVMVEAGAGGMIWDDATLAGYLASPKTFLKGNKMAFAGLKKEADTAAVIAFLKSHP